MIAQAGGSARGRRIAAQYADTIVAHPKGIEAMKEYRDDVRAQMRELRPRSGQSARCCFLSADRRPRRNEEAEERRRPARDVQPARNIDVRLAQLGWTTNIDFSGFDLDAPVGELTTNGHQSSLAQFLPEAGDKTLARGDHRCMPPAAGRRSRRHAGRVAAQMDEVMQEVGGDGFLFALPNVSRRTVAGITDGLVPALQQRGLVRRAYSHTASARQAAGILMTFAATAVTDYPHDKANADGQQSTCARPCPCGLGAVLLASATALAQPRSSSSAMKASIRPSAWSTPDGKLTGVEPDWPARCASA